MSGRATSFITGEMKKIMKDPIEGIYVEYKDESNIFVWTVWMEGAPDTYYEGGIFHLELTFPETFPNQPPELRFISKMWHPNVYPDGKVCISILHQPGDGELDDESADIRWNPTQSITSVLLSVQSLLCDPYFSSPANTDAMVMCRDRREQYKRKCKEISEISKREVPSCIKIPHPDSDKAKSNKGGIDYDDDDPFADEEIDPDDIIDSDEDDE